MFQRLKAAQLFKALKPSAAEKKKAPAATKEKAPAATKEKKPRPLTGKAKIDARLKSKQPPATDDTTHIPQPEE